MMLPKLYKRDSKGKVREWSVTTDANQVIVTHGLVDGKKTSKVTTSKAMNVGRSNETTPEQQAILEAQSKWNYQVDREDYHEDVEQSGQQIRPMLALDYLKVPHRVKWGKVVGQPKLDGLRLVAGTRFQDRRTSDFEMMTRKGESYGVSHLVDEAQELLHLINARCDNRCLALDGELYLHGLPLQTITSYARKHQKWKTETLEFHLFDLVIPDMSFENRWALLASVVREFSSTSIHLVPTSQLIGPNDLDWVHGMYCEMGYEGLMLRHVDGEYKIGDRSPDLFKYKHFYDDEFEITNVWGDKYGNAMLTCLMREGQELSCRNHIVPESVTIECTPKRAHDERKAMLSQQDELIGKFIKIKYQDLTEDGKLQFPVGLEIRECDEHGKPII